MHLTSNKMYNWQWQHHNLNISSIRLRTSSEIKANELCKFRFKLIDTLGPYNNGYFKAKKVLTIFLQFLCC